MTKKLRNVVVDAGTGHPKGIDHSGHHPERDGRGSGARVGSRQLEELLEINLFLSSTLEIKELLLRILEVSQRVLGAEASSVLLLDETTGELQFEQALGEKADKLAPFRVKVGEGIAGKVAATGEPLLVSDVRHDSAFTGKVDAATGFVTRSVLCVPLKIKERVVGVLELLNKRGEGGSFTEEDLARSMAVANVAAVAVENARLYTEKARHLEEIQQLEKIKGEFLSVISHELRTPLVPIKGYVALLQHGNEKLDEETRREYLSSIMNQTDHLARLIEDLFLAIDLEDVSYKLEMERISVRDLIEHAVSLRNPPKETHPVRVAVAAELEEDPERLIIEADKSRLGHAFVHLLDNAVKFSPNGGEITIAIAPATFPHQVEVLVEDRGIGIDPSALPKLFDMFYQADSSTTRRFGGTGNGLYIAKKLIEAHNGRIWAESRDRARPAGGSLFHVLL